MFAASFIACVYDNNPPRRLSSDPAQPYTPTTPSAEPPAAEKPSTPTNTAPMLVEIDTDKTMDAIGGDGVGVFVEYKAGGHWHVWWTCDTTQSKQSCDFAVSATAASGQLSNVDATELPGGFVASPTGSRVDAKSTTTTQVHGIRFDTTPGAVITVDAAIGGLKDGAFLFFVQDEQVNGGFKGQLSNPLQFQGTVP